MNNFSLDREWKIPGTRSQCGVRLVLGSNEYVRVSGEWQQQKMQLVGEMD